MDRPVSIATGVSQLDLILGGGIVQGSLLMITGMPGSGKTVLAAQIASTAADRGERVLFITAFSEPHSKLISNLRTLDFFKQEYIGERINLLNLQHPLLTGLNEAADTLVREAREHKAQMIVLDGLQGMLMAATNPLLPHQFLFDLSIKLSLLNITAVITYDLPVLEDAARSELTAVDGIIVLNQELVGEQAIRTLQVVKQRGVSPLLGRHTFTINGTGLVCYPRQEALSMNADVVLGPERATFGVAALDTMLSGGLHYGTTTILAGAEGVGKSLLCLHFCMQGISAGGTALFVTFHETPQQLIAKGQALGIDLQPSIDAGQLIIQHYSSAEINPDMVAYQLREAIMEKNVQRLAIDGINEIERPLVERQRAYSFFAALVAFLRSQRTTTCVTLEIDPLVGRELSLAGQNLSALSDNIILLERAESGTARHTITVLKMRFSPHEYNAHPYTIGANGIHVQP